MSNLFIDTIIQHGGKLSDSDKVTTLNIIAKHINKKIKIIEYKYGVQIKLPKLSENNSDCLPRKIGIQTFAQIEGPIRGQIPIYTTTEVAVPTQLTAVTTAYPITPYGPYVGIPGLAINPFGQASDRLEDRIKKAEETLERIKKISEKLEKLKTSGKECKDIKDSDSIKKYINCIDLDEPVDDKRNKVTDDELQCKIKKILSKK
jgi:hypothetical protein